MSDWGKLFCVPSLKNNFDLVVSTFSDFDLVEKWPELPGKWPELPGKWPELGGQQF